MYLTNTTISVGPKGADSGDIYVTSTIGFQHPEIEAEGPEVGEKQQVWAGVAQMNVQELIEKIRQLAKDGKLDE